MKIRTDYVTNSSSSSFILAFNDNDRWESYKEFEDQCEYLDYKNFYNLIENCKKDPSNINKEKALEFLFHCSSWYYKKNLVDSEIKEEDYPNFNAYLSARCDYEESDELKKKVKEFVESSHEYQKKKKKIEDATLVVMGEIWDTDGGLLEWAIRNGFVEDNFRNNCVIVWNVG